jgi:hypothetical protein
MKKVISVFVVFIAVVSTCINYVQADVNGDVVLQLRLMPLDTDFEAVEFLIDFEVLSHIKWTVSGVTFGTRLAVGVAGLEHSILTVQSTLGVLDVLSESVFATPFSNGIPFDIDGDGIQNVNDLDIDGDGLLNLADPVPFGSFQGFIEFDIDKDTVPNDVDPDIDGDGILNGIDSTPFGTNFVVSPLTRPIGPTLFVKKRFTTTMNLAGFTITNLAIFEDINFTHPFDSNVQSHSEEFQEFRFCNITTIVGQTVSGINIRSVTGLGADPSVPNLVKKASFQGSICQDSNEFAAALQNFAFCVEQLFIDNIQVGSLKLNSRTEFRILPLTLSETITMQHGFFDDTINVSLSLTSDDLISFSPISSSIFITSAPLSVAFTLDPTFAMINGTATLSINVDGAGISATATFLPATGINTLSFRFQTVSLSGLSIFANTILSDPGAAPNGGFSAQSTTFAVNGNITPNFGVNASIGFTNLGITGFSSQLTYRF